MNASAEFDATRFCAHLHNPFAWDRDRALYAVGEAETIASLIARHSIDLSRPTIAVIDGEPVLRADWAHRQIDGVLLLIALPEGGGGGSNPLPIILSIALIAVAGPLAAGIAGQVGLAGSALTVSALKLGIVVVGNMLISALIPPPKPAQSGPGATLPAASPTYTLQAQGNAARLEQPIPCLYGRHLLYPDFAAEPYAEFSGNEQFLYQLFCLGQGAVTVEAIRIEDSPIASFPEVTTELVPPGGTVTLFPTDVATSGEVSGQELLTGTEVGPFVVNASGTRVNAIAVDIVAPRGLFRFDNFGGMTPMSATWTVEIREIDDSGLPITGWWVQHVETLTHQTTTPQRRSYRYTVAPGRYEVRVRREDTKDTSSQAGHEIAWTALRAYLPGTQQYGQVTMLAMRMRATNSLSQQSARKINVIVQRRLLMWSPVDGWSPAPVETRSIVWALADVIRSQYGGQATSDRLLLAELHDLDQLWTTRGDTFDGVFDSATTIWEALATIARAGRAVPYRQGNLIRFARDTEQSVPVAMFTPRNILKGSLKIEYLMPSPDGADDVEVEFFDATTWRADRVRCMLPGSLSLRPAKVKLFGVTSRAQAWREGMYLAAVNRYRRRFVTWQTELEGFIPSIGDLVGISHDLPEWGQWGEVVSVTGLNVGGGIDAGGVIELDEAVTFGAGAHAIALRRRDGSMAGPYVVTAGADDRHVVLTDAVLGFQPDTGAGRERAYFAFGPVTRELRLARILPPIRPRQNGVELQAVIEDERVHSADGGSPPGVVPGWPLPSIPQRPSIDGLPTLTAGGTIEQPTISASWRPAPGALRYAVEHSLSGAQWVRIGEFEATETTFIAPVEPAVQYVRVAPIGETQGDWRAASITVTGAPWAPAPATLTGLVAVATQMGAVLTWTQGNYAYADRTEILRSASADPLTAVVIATIRGPVGIYYDNLGGANITRHWWVRQIDRRGNAGVLSNRAQATSAQASNTIPAANSITMAMIASDFVYAGLLAADVVKAGNIDANAITARELAANSITAAKGQISDLAVGTLKIQDQAVTAAVSAYNDQVSLPPTDTWANIISATIVSSGAPITILLSSTFGVFPQYPYSETKFLTWEIVLDGTTIFTTSQGVNHVVTSNDPLELAPTFVPAIQFRRVVIAAGVHTVLFRARVSRTNVAALFNGIVLMEVKK